MYRALIIAYSHISVGSGVGVLPLCLCHTISRGHALISISVGPGVGVLPLCLCHTISRGHALIPVSGQE